MSTKRTVRDPDPNPDLEEQEYYDDMISSERCGSPHDWQFICWLRWVGGWF